jgi:5-methylcytosine-specific restriction endonuclease McrA
MNPADLRAHLVRLLDALEGRACADLSSEYRLRVCAHQVRLVLARLGEVPMSQRCLRSKQLRLLLWLAAEGRCQKCGIDLPDNWHADHVVPFSSSGKTNVFEMQALCPTCNLKKGSR